MATSDCCSTRRASSASSWSGTTSALRIRASKDTASPLTIMPKTSRTFTTPRIVSGDPSATGSSECGLPSISLRISCSLAPRSIQSSSVRGVIISRTGRSASRTTPARIWCCSASITPERVASAKIMCSSSAVTLDWPPGRMPNKRMSRPDDVSSNQTSGAAMAASTAIGRAIKTAIGTAILRAICLGTSSPTTTLR